MCELVDRVVGAGARAVSARVPCLQLKVDEHLLACVHSERARLPVRELDAATVRIEAVLGVDERALVGEHPLHAPGRVSLLVCREERDDVPVRCPPLALPSDEVRDEDRHAGLVVLRAASHEESILEAQLERVRRPVGALRFHDVEVRGEKNGLLAGTGPTQPHDEIPVLRIRADDVDVARRIARCDEPRSQLVRESGGAADGGRRVGVDRLGQHLSREALVGERERVRRGGLRRERRGRDNHDDRAECAHAESYTSGHKRRRSLPRSSGASDEAGGSARSWRRCLSALALSVGR